ncbi:MAG TPA: GrpB family protein [Polyangiaceae bacterium]|nr:GrpB family protein [Polyangiaceae bacterium]
MSAGHTIVVRDYDPAWPAWFEAICQRVWPAVEGVALRIDHVGSTSVPGLAAKPIIDLDVVVASEGDVRPVVERLAAVGYAWVGDLGIAGREAFKPVHDQGLPAHNLYLVVENNRAHQDHWLLRDLLRADASARERYAALKRKNAERARGDLAVYVAAKAELVAELLTRARAERGLPPETYWQPAVTWPESGPGRP